MPRLLPHGLVSRALGVLLLLTAALKLHGLRVDAVASLGVLSAPELQVALVEFEIFLGIWLLSGKGVIGAWLTAILTFAVFALVSAYQGFIGQASCGCFGRLSQWVRPWHAFALDLTILLLLGLGRPPATAFRENRRAALRAALLPLAGGVLGVLAVLGLLTGAVHIAFGSSDAALAYLRGERLSVSPRLLDMGHGQPGDVRKEQVTIANWTDKPVRLIGGTSDCSCQVLEDLPVTIPPGESRAITISMRLRGKAGIFNRKATLRTDDEHAPILVVRLTGRITAPEERQTAESKRGN